jgi:hypothetical protein
VRDIAMDFGRRFGTEPVFDPGPSASSALLSDARKGCELFGAPLVTAAEMIEAIAFWIRDGGATLNKPTHFDTRDGKF